MTNIDKKALYESIMKNVAIEVKKYLTESAQSSLYNDTTWKEFVSRQNTLEDLVCAFNGVYNIYDIDIDLFDSTDMGFIWFEDNDDAQTLGGFIKEVKKYGFDDKKTGKFYEKYDPRIIRPNCPFSEFLPYLSFSLPPYEVNIHFIIDSKL